MLKSSALKPLNSQLNKPSAMTSRFLSCTLFLAASLVPELGFADCPTPGQWWQAQRPMANSELLASAAQQQIVLLGEQHDEVAHHRWQLHTLAGLHALRDEMVIGLEMLPRSTQPALDAWVAGELDAVSLLSQTRWDEAWGFDPELYMPILHFARMSDIPLVALNIDATLRQRLVNDGFNDVPMHERHNIPPPKPASTAYQTRLTEVFDQHDMGDDPERLERFIQAQLIWDIAMAQRLNEAAESDAIVIGLMGLGHVAYNDGVPYQLEALGIEHVLSLLPWQQRDCTPPDPEWADAVFILENTQP